MCRPFPPHLYPAVMNRWQLLGTSAWQISMLQAHLGQQDQSPALCRKIQSIGSCLLGFYVIPTHAKNMAVTWVLHRAVVWNFLHMLIVKRFQRSDSHSLDLHPLLFLVSFFRSIGNHTWRSPLTLRHRLNTTTANKAKRLRKINTLFLRLDKKPPRDRLT